MNQTDFESKFLLGNQTYTLFLPSNLAVKQMGRKQQEGFEQDESTIGFLMDHVADKKYLTQRLTNDMAIYSLKNQPIRVNKRYISEVRTSKCKLGYLRKLVSLGERRSMRFHK